jgi:hypothetical protein
MYYTTAAGEAQGFSLLLRQAMAVSFWRFQLAYPVETFYLNFPLIHALPHHIQSFTESMPNRFPNAFCLTLRCVASLSPFSKKQRYESLDPHLCLFIDSG